MDFEDASPTGRRSTRQLRGGVRALDADVANSDEDTDTRKRQHRPPVSGDGPQTVRRAPWRHTARFPSTPAQRRLA